jgi:hypothetical protein
MKVKRQVVWLFDRGLKHAPPEYGTGVIVALRHVSFEVRLGLYRFYLNHFHRVF